MRKAEADILIKRPAYDRLVQQCKEESDYILKTNGTSCNWKTLLDLTLSAYELKYGSTRTVFDESHKSDSNLLTDPLHRKTLQADLKTKLRFSPTFNSKRGRTIKEALKYFDSYDQVILSSNGVGFYEVSEMGVECLLHRTGAHLDGINVGYGKDYTPWRCVDRSGAKRPIIIAVMDGRGYQSQQYKECNGLVDYMMERGMKGFIVTSPHFHEKVESKVKKYEVDLCPEMANPTYKINHDIYQDSRPFSVVTPIGFGPIIPTIEGMERLKDSDISRALIVNNKLAPAHSNKDTEQDSQLRSDILFGTSALVVTTIIKSLNIGTKKIENIPETAHHIPEMIMEQVSNSIEIEPDRGKSFDSIMDYVPEYMTQTDKFKDGSDSYKAAVIVNEMLKLSGGLPPKELEDQRKETCKFMSKFCTLHLKHLGKLGLSKKYKDPSAKFTEAYQKLVTIASNKGSDILQWEEVTCEPDYQLHLLWISTTGAAWGDNINQDFEGIRHYDQITKVEELYKRILTEEGTIPEPTVFPQQSANFVIRNLLKTLNGESKDIILKYEMEEYRKKTEEDQRRIQEENNAQIAKAEDRARIDEFFRNIPPIEYIPLDKRNLP